LLHALPCWDHGARKRRGRPARHRQSLERLCRFNRGLALTPAGRAGTQDQGRAGLGRLPPRAEGGRRSSSQRTHPDQAQRQRQTHPTVQAFDHSPMPGRTRGSRPDGGARRRRYRKPDLARGTRSSRRRRTGHRCLLEGRWSGAQDLHHRPWLEVLVDRQGNQLPG
jgi:hypothetical protein